MRICLLNHPLAAVQDRDKPEAPRDASFRSMVNNIADAHEWLRFLVASVTPRIAILAPAIPYASSQVDAASIIAMTAMVIPRCDLMVDINAFSGHMGLMHNVANLHGVPAVNLTRWRRRPPWGDDAAIREINDEFGSALPAKYRSIRVTMSAQDIMALREAEEKLVTDPDNMAAVQVIRDILTAAARP